MADIAIANSDTVTTVVTGGTNTRNIDLCTNRAVGDLLFVALVGSSSDATPNTAVTGGGWTKKEEVFVNSAGHGTIFYRVCDGTESSPITVTNDLNEDVAAVSFRIPAALWHGTTMPEFAASWYISAGNQAAPDPPSVTASWSGEKNLFVVFVYSDTTSGNVTAPPSGYTADVKSAGGYAEARTGTSAGGGVGVCAKVTTADSDDPGTATTANTRALAMTMVVRPAAGTTQIPPISRGCIF